MANLVLKPSTGAGNSVIIKDQGGGAVLTTADSGAEINNVTSITASGNLTIVGDLIPATPLSHRNKIINGNFDVWQRGSTHSNGSATYHYSADRWVYYNYNHGSATAVTRQAFTVGQTNVPGEPTYYLRHTNGSSNTEWLMNQRIEDVRTFAGKTATVSLWMKTSQAQTVRLRVDQNFGTGGSPSSIVYSSTQDCSVTTSWQKFTKTFSVASISGKTIGSDGANTSYLALAIGSLGATSIASQSVDIAQVQFELGSSATPFEHRSYQDELARCQRYCHVIGDTVYQAFGPGVMYNSTASIIYVQSPVTMRTTPAISKNAGGTGTSWLHSYVGASGKIGNPTPELGEGGSNSSFRIYVPGSNNSTTAGYGSWNMIMPNASFTFSAEL